MANHSNNLFATKIGRQQGSQRLPTHYVFNNRVQDPTRNNRRISTHLEEQNILPAEQEGCHPGSKECKDQLMVSKAIYDEWKKNKN